MSKMVPRSKTNQFTGSEKPKVVCRISPSPMAFSSIFKGQMRYLNENGFETVIICSDGPEVNEVRNSEGCRVITVPFSRYISFKTDIISIYRIYKILQQVRPDIVHTHTSKAGLLGMIAATAARVPVKIHSVPGLRLIETTGVTFAVLYFFERLIYQLSTYVYPNSRSLKEYITKKRMCPFAKIRMVGNGSSNGVDIKRFNPQLKQSARIELLRSKIGIDNGAIIIAYLGRIVKEKGIHELVESFQSLCQKNYNVYLLLIGKYEDAYDSISMQVKHLIDYHQNIHVTGWDNNVENYLAACDILVHPSYREGFSNAILQGGAMGLPIIACDIPGCNDVIRDNETGLLVTPKDPIRLTHKIEKLINNPALSRKLGQAARNHAVGNYGNLELWKEIKQEYNTLLNGV